VPEDVLCLLPAYLETVGTSRLGQTCRAMAVVPGLVAHLRKALEAKNEAAKKVKTARREKRVKHEHAQAVERKNYPVGAIVFGAPLARGRAGASIGDYDLRVIVVAPTNSTDDYRLGYLPTGGTEQLVEATVGQRGFGATFMVVLAPDQQLPWHPPQQLGNWCSADAWRDEVTALRAALARGPFTRHEPRASPWRTAP
jgi:hypothetical protein